MDLLSLSAHKFYGPKGAGVLYVRRGVTFWPQQHGGGQERGRRAGTENVPGIVGLAKALELAEQNRPQYVAHCQALRDRLIQGVLERIPGAVLTGHPTQRLPNNASFCLEGIDAESLLLMLDRRGVCASSGSACTSGSLEPSHVLLAMGIQSPLALGSLRLTVGLDNTPEQIDRALDILVESVQKLRALTPAARR